jgi:hypothetical protein
MFLEFFPAKIAFVENKASQEAGFGGWRTFR